MNWNEKFCKLLEMELFLNYTRAKELIAKDHDKRKKKEEENECQKQ